jgi:hypothetical protein
MEGGEDGEKRCRTKELGILATKPLRFFVQVKVGRGIYFPMVGK